MMNIILNKRKQKNMPAPLAPPSAPIAPLAPSATADLLAIAGNLLDSIDPLCYMNPQFEQDLVVDLCKMLTPYVNALGYAPSIVLEDLAEQAIELFYAYVAPPRSYDCTFNLPRHAPTIAQQIEFLKNVPQPDQRTPEWYAFRHRYLTASSIWKAFGTTSSRNQLIYDKCRPHQADKYNGVSTESPMHWGQRYEPLSVMLYELLNATQVSDFGCIPHPALSFLAASPDGINTLEASAKYGRMLEVKNIFNRDIDGVPKLEYWIQMQMQMEVCALDECDFLETRFKEYDDEAAFKQDALDEDCWNRTCSGEHKGVILYFMQGDKPLYKYAPVSAEYQSFAVLAAWEEKTMEEHAHLSWMKTIYWRLDELSCVLVLRNQYWFAAAVPVLNDLWATIEKEKVTGYAHRAPAKRKVAAPEEKKVEPEQKCYLDYRALC